MEYVVTYGYNGMTLRPVTETQFVSACISNAVKDNDMRVQCCVGSV